MAEGNVHTKKTSLLINNQIQQDKETKISLGRGLILHNLWSNNYKGNINNF